MGALLSKFTQWMREFVFPRVQNPCDKSTGRTGALFSRELTPSCHCLAGLRDIAVRYDDLIFEYVDKCPFHLFDTRRQRNIDHAELKEDISSSLMRWLQIPLTCTEVVEIICQLVPPHVVSVRPYVFAAMTKSPLTGEDAESEARFILALCEELEPFGWHKEMATILPAVRKLIKRKRRQTSMPSREAVLEQIALSGQYAILSHRWGGEELAFDDVACLSDVNIQTMKGFEKLRGFERTVEARYGCRYLWMDTACISEALRKKSIPKMFGWYRHAYVCVVYLSTYRPDEDSEPESDSEPELWGDLGISMVSMEGVSDPGMRGGMHPVLDQDAGQYIPPSMLYMSIINCASTSRGEDVELQADSDSASNSDSHSHSHLGVGRISSPAMSYDLWCTRGWTLQELLASSKVKCVTGDWSSAAGGIQDKLKFDICRDNSMRSSMYPKLRDVMGGLDWNTYTPGVENAIEVLHAMLARETTEAEDMVYCVLSTLNISIPIEYKEGFDVAFYRLQVQILTQSNNRRFLLWESRPSSRCNSMLAARFPLWNFEDKHATMVAPSVPDPRISFDSDCGMHIMASLYPDASSSRDVFALMGETSGQDGTYYGVLLRRRSGSEQVYERISVQTRRKNELSLEQVPEWVHIK